MAQECAAPLSNRLTDALSISPLSDGTLSGFFSPIFCFFFACLRCCIFIFRRCQRGRDPAMQPQLSKKLKKRKKRRGGHLGGIFGLVRQRKSNLDGRE